MNKILFLLICVFQSLGVNSQNLFGAWQGLNISKTGEELKSVIIFSKGYQTISVYNSITGKLVKTNGGTWRLEGNTLIEKVEFDTNDSDRIGKEVRLEIFINDTDSELTIVGRDIKYKRLDNGTPGTLQGTWLLSEKINNEKGQQNNFDFSGKRMKILSGTRFQWIDYNEETKQFTSTYGGTYTAIDGEYTEKVEFSAFDDFKMGYTSKFSFRLIDGNWHHDGVLNKGNRTHEIWSIRK